MEKYLITKDTIGLLKKGNKTIIYNVNKIEVINKNINYILEYNCKYYGSTFLGRKKFAQNVLNIKYKVPIIIDDDNNIILLQLNSLRKDECLLLIFNKVLNYEQKNYYLLINCLNKYSFRTLISLNSFENLIFNAIKIKGILNYRKKRNFL